MFLKNTSLLKNPLKCFTTKTLITKSLNSNSKLNIFSGLNQTNFKKTFYFLGISRYSTKPDEQKEKESTSKNTTDNKETKEKKSETKRKENTSSSSTSSDDESVSLDKYMELKKEYLEIANKTEQYKKKFEEARKAYLDNKEETEQMRKRLEKENQQIKEHAITKFSKDLIDVCDNFDRALEYIKDKDFDKLTNQEKNDLYNNFIERVTSTQTVLASTLHKHGVTEFNPVNEKFDPNKHDAVFDYLDEEKVI
jgi:molecular chaperone GrpE